MIVTFCSSGHSANRSFQNPVPGDPCEFGHVGFLSTWETKELESKYNNTVAKNARLAMGVTSSFTWLAAQAMNQGIFYKFGMLLLLT